MKILPRLQGVEGTSWITLLARTALLSLSLSSVAVADQAPIDQAIVLRVGDIKLSHYLLDKYYGRFVATRKKESGKPPSLQDTKTWFELFLSRQVLVAQAWQQGYQNRAEIDDIVTRMSRYILTKPDGPYYARLYSGIPSPSESRTRSLYLKAAIDRDSLIVRIDGTLNEREILGDDFSTQDPAEKLRRLSSLTTTNGVLVYKGHISWPYHPFSEIADALLDLPTGSLFEQHRPLLGAFYAYVRSDSMQHLPEYETVRSSFLQSVALFDKEQFLQRRRSQILEKARFSLNGPAAKHLSDFVQRLPTGISEIPENNFGPLWKAELFSYKVEGREESISVGRFCAHFNKLFVRQMPATIIILRQCTQDMAMEDLDFRAALKAGINRDVTFVEDRYGFSLMQVLDLFEKEIILPDLKVESANVQDYYDHHLSDFQRTTAVRGRLVKYSTGGVAAPQREDAVEVSAASPLPGFENLQWMILNGKPGQQIGPARYKDNLVVFIKEKDLAKEPIPIGDVVSTIKAALLRQQLNAREVVLASQIYNTLRIEDNINYAEYGLTPSNGSVPWKR